MAKVKSGKRLIIDALQKKACTKQSIYQITHEAFDQFKKELQQLQTKLSETFERIDKNVTITYRELGEFEAELKFGGDVLYFAMHTNVFTFENTHEIFKTKYIQDEPLRAYFGMITVYNFLADSIKYNRPLDLGYLVARIFINREKHFFVDGERPMSFLYSELESTELNEGYIKAIIESTVLYALDFDLFVPPFREVNMMTVKDKMQLSGSAALRTGKRLGFQLSSEANPL